MLLMLSGAIGAGKDTFGEFLYDSFDKFGYNVEVVKFADPIREAAFKLGFNPDDRATKEVPAIRHYKLSELDEAIFTTHTCLTPYERRMVAVRVHQRLINIRKEKHDGIYKPVVSTREFMQVVGGAVRDAKEDYYIQHMVLNVPESRINICTDTRFVNEQAIGDYSVYVERPNNPLAVNTLDASEAAQALLRGAAKKVILNHSTLDNLAELADYVATTLILKGYCDDAVKNASGTGIFIE